MVSADCGGACWGTGAAAGAAGACDAAGTAPGTRFFPGTRFGRPTEVRPPEAGRRTTSAVSQASSAGEVHTPEGSPADAGVVRRWNHSDSIASKIGERSCRFGSSAGAAPSSHEKPDPDLSHPGGPDVPSPL